jgi:pimeloyl-ACP methyl ester carboxylesterase
MASDVDFVEIEDAGHLVPFEKPDELAGIVLDWMG